MTTTFGDVVRAVALGDAWGDPGEFKRLADLTKTNPRGPEVPDQLRITDDTQMTLFLADALDLAGPDATVEETQSAIMDAFLVYYKDPDTGSRAPGTTVMGSLGSLSRRGGRDWTKTTNNHSDGSGTVMRTSPCAFLSEDRWVGVTAFAAAVTHGTANAIAAAILDVAILRAQLRGDDGVVPGQLLSTALTFARDPQALGLLDVGTWLDGYEIPDGLESGFSELVSLLEDAVRILPVLQDNPWAPESDPSDQDFYHAGAMGAGWRAHHTLVVALLAVDMLPGEPLNGLRRAVVTAGDSDTIGAVAGALLAASGFRVTEEYFDRFEPRYQNWIENEADVYVFVNPVVEVPARKGWFARLFS